MKKTVNSGFRFQVSGFRFLKNIKSLCFFIILLSFLFSLSGETIAAASGTTIAVPKINFGLEKSDKPEDIALSLQILIFLTVLSLAPTILIMLTSFTRIVVILSFTRTALATQQAPPNQVIIGLSLFLTLFIMGPVFTEINKDSIQPFMNKEITFQVALDKAVVPLREFMFRQTRDEDLAVFLEAANLPRPNTLDDIPTDILIPSFIISELRIAFEIGFLIFIPFLLIDVVVATTLMTMGMMMVPPMMISLPLKLLLFIMVDGWNLIIRAIVLSFN